MSGFFDKLYQHSPYFVQNIGVSFYGLKLYRREYGSKLRELLDVYEKRQWFSPGDLENFQNQKLAKLIDHCYENVRYYRNIMDDRGLKPEDIRTVGDISKLPVLTRDDVRNNFDALTAMNFNHSSLIIGHTSGTTGSPLEFYYDANVCRAKNAAEWRQKGVAGIKLGDPIAFFLGRMVVPIKRKSPPFWRYNWVLKHLYFSSFHLSKANIGAYINKLLAFKPKALEGYPSTIYILAAFLESINRTLPLQAVFTSSEPLQPYQRELMEKVFNASVFDYYGMAERVAFATECEVHAGKHQNSDFGIMELLGPDGRPVKAGSLGRIVATGLHNYAMPLIRYQTSDISSSSPEQCKCGRGFPLMSNVMTKDEDIVTTPDGRFISSSILTHPFKPMHSVAESQIIQDSLYQIRILIVKRDSYKSSDTDYLKEEFKKRLGADINVEVEFVDTIPRTAAGKYKWVVSRVPLNF